MSRFGALFFFFFFSLTLALSHLLTRKKNGILLSPQLLAKLAFRVDPASDGAGLARMLEEANCGEKKQAGKRKGKEEEEATTTTRAAEPLPPAAAAAVPSVPFPPPQSEKKADEENGKMEVETEEGLDKANDLEEGSLDLDSLDLAALASLGDDDELASVLEGMLRGDGDGGDELFRRVFERVDGAVAEALMMSAVGGVEAEEVEAAQ